MARDIETTAPRGEGLWLRAPWAIAALVLLAPLVAMGFTDGVDWTAFDFAVAGLLLFGACGIFELAIRASGTLAYRAAAGLAILTGLVLIWINLAVGIIGSEDNPANLMYPGVIVIALAGAFLARFRPSGMARAMATAAVAQALAGAAALIAGWGAGAAKWPADVIFSSIGFAALWLLSGWLFHKAAERPAKSA